MKVGEYNFYNGTISETHSLLHFCVSSNSFLDINCSRSFNQKEVGQYHGYNFRNGVIR